MPYETPPDIPPDFRWLFKRAWLRQRLHVSLIISVGPLACAKTPQMAPDSSTSITEVSHHVFQVQNKRYELKT